MPSLTCTGHKISVNSYEMAPVLVKADIFGKSLLNKSFSETQDLSYWRVSHLYSNFENQLKFWPLSNLMAIKL